MISTLKNKVVDLMSKRGRAASLVVAFFILLTGVFLIVEPANAGWVAKTIADILNVIVSFMGKMILLLFEVAVGWLAPYNDFVRSAAVTTGWVLTRDVANMFFILILLAIAFGTILKIEQLNYQKILPKLLIMAILINFSKTICGAVIDLAQVIMLTFVNAFMQAAGGNFLNALGIYRMMQINEASSLAIDDLEVVKAFLFAAAFMVVALIVIIVYVMVLAYRIVMLWVLIILAPVAWLGGAFPIGKASNAYAEWWDNFTGAVTVGPILAFFLWLALLTAGGGTLGSTFENPAYTQSTQEQAVTGELATAGGNNFFLNEQGTSEATTGFIIAISLLLAGLAAAQQSGGMAGSFAGQAASKTKGFAGRAIKGAAVGAGSLAVAGARKGASEADRRLGLREGAFRTMARVPGLKGFGYKQLGKVRGERAAKREEDYGYVKSLAPKEAHDLMQQRGISSDQRMMLSQVAMTSGFGSYLKKDMGYTDSDVQNFQAKELANMQRLATSKGDVRMMKEAKDIQEKRPDLIQDTGDRKKAVMGKTADEIKSMSLSAFQDTTVLEGLAEMEKQKKGAVLDSIKGQQKAILQEFLDKYPSGKAPGEGRFTLQKGYEASEADAFSAFRDKARTNQIETLIRERNYSIAGAPETISGGGDERKWSADSRPATNMAGIHMSGGSAQQAYNFDPKTRKFNADPSIDSVAAKNTFQEAVGTAAENIKNEAAGPDTKANAAQFISNIDVGAVEMKGEYRDAVLESVDHESLAQALQSSSGDQKAQVEKLITSVSEALKDKMKNLDPSTEVYQALLEKHRKMKMNQGIYKHVT